MLELKNTPGFARNKLVMTHAQHKQVGQHCDAHGFLTAVRVPTDLVLAQSQARFQLPIHELHLPDIMPPKVEAFTRCTSHPRNGYATCSLGRCPSGLPGSAPLPTSRAGALS